LKDDFKFVSIIKVAVNKKMLYARFSKVYLLFIAFVRRILRIMF